MEVILDATCQKTAKCNNCQNDINDQRSVFLGLIFILFSIVICTKYLYHMLR